MRGQVATVRVRSYAVYGLSHCAIDRAVIDGPKPDAS